MRVEYKKFAIIFLFAFFVASIAHAEDGKAELKAKLKDLRGKKAQMSSEYEENLRRVDKEAEDRLTVLKADFRKSREECLTTRHEKSEQLRKDYEGKLKPMLKEEGGLIESIGRDAREDFAKTRKEKETVE